MVDVRHVIDAAPGLPGDAPMLVLSNALGTAGEIWDFQVPALARHFRVIRYDTRGHGDSPVPPGPYTVDDLADDVVALLDRLGVQRAHFAGVSLGGMTGMSLAARHPDRVDRLALLATSAYAAPAQRWIDRSAAVRNQGIAPIAESIVANWYTPAFAAAHPDVVATRVATLAANPAEGYASCCDAIATMDLRDLLGSITAPTLGIAGAVDPSTPADQLERIAAAIPGMQLVVLPDSAHMVQEHEPELVTNVLIDHFTAAA